MIQIRRAEERGHFDHRWLNTYHTFSFAEYQDPNHMNFRSLRVINEDFVNSGEGFPPHSHRDMEILTFILEGSLEHKDSMGNGSVIQPGDVQRMSAGSGVTHSEYNPSSEKAVHLLQIWIFPEEKNLEPSYEQTHISEENKKNKLCLIASKNPIGEAVKIHQDVELFASILNQNKELNYSLKSNRYAWLQVAKGSVELNHLLLKSGDGAAISQEKELKIRSKENRSEILLFDLA